MGDTVAGHEPLEPAQAVAKVPRTPEALRAWQNDVRGLFVGAQASLPARNPERELLNISVEDCRAQARMQGWGFWRGAAVGFLAGYPLAYAALNGGLPFVPH